jgi:hypothetical protein
VSVVLYTKWIIFKIKTVKFIKIVVLYVGVYVCVFLYMYIYNLVVSTYRGL